MPAKRKTYARRRPAARRTYKRRATGARLSKAAWLYGKMYDRTKRQERLATGLAELSGAALNVPQEAVQESNDAYMARKVTGRGAYAFGRQAQRFLQGRMGTAIRDRAVGMISGQGMYTGQGAYGHGGFGASTAKHILGNGMYTGQGEYSGNNLIDDATSAGAVPSFGSVNDETGAVVITHREYIGDIYANPSTEDFKNTAYPINPGLEQTFPWLSQIAQNFEEYELLQCMFTYRSTMADVSSANGQVGTVIMATNYNPSEGAFRDKSRMMGYAHSSSDKSTSIQIHGVECDPSKNSGSSGKYIRSQELPTGEDIKMYDHGLFQVATANTPTALANLTIAELWVSYTVVLRKPQYFVNQGLGITRSIFTNGPQAPYSMRDVGIMGETSLILKGKQNGLNVLVESLPTAVVGGDPALRLTFPASYSGNLEIRLVMRLQAGDENDDERPAMYMLAGVAPNQLGAGNVYAINDMYLGDGTLGVASSATPGYAITTKADPLRYIAIFHIRVDIASFGIDNSVAIIMADGNIADSTVEETLLGTTLNISEYNQSLGTDNDPRPILVNSSGVVVNYALAA